MAGFPDVTDRGTSFEQPEYSCGHDVKTDLSAYGRGKQRNHYMYIQFLYKKKLTMYVNTKLRSSAYTTIHTAIQTPIFPSHIVESNV